MRSGYLGKGRGMKVGRLGGQLHDWNSEVEGMLLPCSSFPIQREIGSSSIDSCW